MMKIVPMTVAQLRFLGGGAAVHDGPWLPGGGGGGGGGGIDCRTSCNPQRGQKTLVEGIGV